MHGNHRAAPHPSMLEEKMIIDPVCRMTIDPTTAAASEVVDGKRVYFCSEACRRRFRVNPTAYAAAVVSPSVSGSPQRCSSSWGGRCRPASERDFAQLLFRGVDLRFGLGVHRRTIRRMVALYRDARDRFWHSGRPLRLSPPRGPGCSIGQGLRRDRHYLRRCDGTDSASGMRRFRFDLDGLPRGAHIDGATLTFTAISPTTPSRSAPISTNSPSTAFRSGVD